VIAYAAFYSIITYFYFRGAAHNSCNLARVVVRRIPLICHNFSGYDCHLVVQGLRPDPRIRSLQALPKNSERFRTLELNNYLFLDSLSFLDGSLAAVVEDLRESGHAFPLLDQANLCRSPLEKALLLKKGVYPYEHCHSVEQLRSETQLPPIEAFFSKVSNCGISNDDYRHAQAVFSTFRCRTMLDYCERELLQYRK
jgi:hypothetical protein